MLFRSQVDKPSCLPSTGVVADEAHGLIDIVGEAVTLDLLICIRRLIAAIGGECLRFRAAMICLLACLPVAIGRRSSTRHDVEVFSVYARVCGERRVVRD